MTKTKKQKGTGEFADIVQTVWHSKFQGFSPREGCMLIHSYEVYSMSPNHNVMHYMVYTMCIIMLSMQRLFEESNY